MLSKAITQKLWNPGGGMTQSQPSYGSDLFRGPWWFTSARVFLEGPVARCQGLLDPGEGKGSKTLVAR